jgi:predicted secreted protein
VAPLDDGLVAGCHSCLWRRAATRQTSAESRGEQGRRYPAGIKDRRSGQVAFVSHCLLNQNVRYLGGATQPGIIAEVVDRYRDAGIGIYQMPCPEQHAWGGVLKPLMTRWYGSHLVRRRSARKLIAGASAAWTQLRYERLARRVVSDIVDYQRSGLEVVEVLGVGASPSCGVTTTIDLEAAMAAMSLSRLSALDASTVNRRVVAANVIDGPGLFTLCLRHQLRSHGITVAFGEHDLLGELRQAGLLPTET